MAEYPDNLSCPNFPVSLRAMLCCLHGKDLTIKARRYNLAEAPEELLASRAMDHHTNARASQRVADMPRATSTNDCAIYVMGPASGAASKIGVSASPLVRLQQLQAGNYEPLKIYALFWLPEGQAFGVERLSLRVIAKMGRRLTGEWCDLSPPDITSLIACVLKSNQAVQVSDSEMQIENIGALYGQDDDLQYSLALKRRATPESVLLKKMA